jgi:hypothetical protein
MNANFDSAVGYIWHRCGEEEDRNPPDYWFSFARRYTETLAGEMSKDMRQSYSRAKPRRPQFPPRSGDVHWIEPVITGDEELFHLTEPDGDDRTADLRRPDPTDHGAQDQQWSSPHSLALPTPSRKSLK